MAQPETIRELERRGFAALPALESEDFDGWVLRASGGYTGRANSAAPLYPGDLDTGDKIAHTEAWYRTRGLPPMFRLTPVCEPTGLEAALVARGYALRDEGVSVRTLSLGPTPEAPEEVAVSMGEVPESWLMALAGFQSRVADRLDVVREMFGRLPATSAFAAIERDGSPVAIGRAVLEGHDVGLFDVITRADHQQQGLGRSITFGLLAWGIARGARRAYLQVVPGNSAAMSLYGRLGFEEVYRYWYRAESGVKS